MRFSVYLCDSLAPAFRWPIIQPANYIALYLNQKVKPIVAELQQWGSM